MGMFNKDVFVFHDIVPVHKALFNKLLFVPMVLSSLPTLTAQTLTQGTIIYFKT